MPALHFCASTGEGAGPSVVVCRPEVTDPSSDSLEIGLHLAQNERRRAPCSVALAPPRNPLAVELLPPSRLRASLEQDLLMDDDLKQLIENAAAETRRHFDIVAEGLRQDVRLALEGVTANGERLDRLAVEMKQEFAEVRSMVR